MFGFPLALTYKIFGISLPVSRLHVLVLLILAMIRTGLDSHHRPIIILFTLVTLFQYQVFHSSHFSMAEMLSVASILLSVHFLARAFDRGPGQKKVAWQAIWSGVFISLAYYIKIQFIYLVFLLPVVVAALYARQGQAGSKLITRQGFALTAVLLSFLLLYFLAWYLPNKTAYDHMMAYQSGELKLSGKTWEYIRFNLGYHFLNGRLQWFFYFFLVIAVTGALLVKHARSARFPVWYFASLAWFLLELHKLVMVYLPTRYQVSLLAAMGLLISVVSVELFSGSLQRFRIPVRIGTASVILILLMLNLNNYRDSFRNRTFVIRETNRYLAEKLKKGDAALGAWAPSFTWDSKARAIPVWNYFLNYREPIEAFHPKVIIAETDEQDSEQAWKGQGISLPEVADSVKTVQVGHWEIRIYWMNLTNSQPYLKSF
jgi:hypothetical protein